MAASLFSTWVTRPPKPATPSSAFRAEGNLTRRDAQAGSLATGLAACLMGAALLLGGCASTDIGTGASEDVSGQEAAAALDSTVQLGHTIDPSVYSKTIQSCCITDWVMGSSLEEMSSWASDVISGTIVSIAYTSYDGSAYTKADVEIDTCISGNLQEGQTISVFLRQGYIPLAEQLAWEQEQGGGSKFDYTEEEIANTVIIEHEEGEDLAAVGDSAVFFLSACEGIEEFEGGYFRTRGASSELMENADGTFTQNMSDEDEPSSYSMSQIKKSVASVER